MLTRHRRCLPHDWLTWRLSGSSDIADLCTDRSDASGTGYYSAEANCYQTDLLELAFRGRSCRATGARTARLRGRDAAGAVWPRRRRQCRSRTGIGSGAGDCVVSLGTSGVVSAVGQAAPHDTEGIVAGFADATGRRASAGGTLNGARYWPRSPGC